MNQFHPHHSITSQAWRNRFGGYHQWYGYLDPAYSIHDEYAGTEFCEMDGALVAIDPGTGLLKPAWAYAAGQQQVFAETFVGYASEQPDGTRKRVNVMFDGGDLRMWLEDPVGLKLGTYITPADNPETGRLHGWVGRQAQPGEAIGLVGDRSGDHIRRRTVGVHVVNNLLVGHTRGLAGAGGPV